MPERHVSLTIYVKVKRSVRAPRFDNLPYQIQRVSETKSAGREIFRVRAHDPDLQVRNIELGICGNFTRTTMNHI